MAKVRITKRNKSMLIGLACGLGCALCVGLYTMQVDEQVHAAQAEMLAKYGGDQIDVCVARHDIPAGQVISESDIETKTWIASLLPQNAITDRTNAVGKQVGSTILAGEVISPSRFGLESADIEVPDGFSAISVPIKDVQAVGGALKPGMVADVYATGANSTSRIATSVLILATSTTSDSASSQGAWITLAIKPARAEEMVSAAQNLELYFVLPSASTTYRVDEGEDVDDIGSRSEKNQQSEGADHGIEGR